MSSGRVFVGEDFDDEPGFLSARFSAHWESDTEPVRFEEGPQGVTIQEAVAWARRRADVVLVRLGDEDIYRSAGVQRPQDDELGDWPVPGFVARRRRDPRQWYLARTERDEPISWLACIHLFEPAAARLPRGERALRALVDAIAGRPECQVIRCSLDHEDVHPPSLISDAAAQRNRIGVEVRVIARTYAEAETLAGAVAERAKASGDALLAANSKQPGWGLSYGVTPEQTEPPSHGC